ncbi:Transcription factor DIVARICATA, partial [Mucuna pruriens]
MGVEIIDLDDTPPPPHWSSKAPRIVNFGAASKENQFEKAPMPLRACTNSNLHHTTQLQTTLWPASTHTYEPSQIGFSFQSNVHVNRVATVLEPVPELNTHLFPHGARLKEPWNQREHELFLMGLIKYGRGPWSKIARDFVCNKTPQQVQRYAASFFRHLPSTHLHGFRRRRATYFDANSLPTNKKNLMGVNETKQILALFPEKASYFPVPPYGEAGNSFSATTKYQFQLQTGGASTSKSASANGKVDLELHLVIRLVVVFVFVNVIKGKRGPFSCSHSDKAKKDDVDAIEYYPRSSPHILFHLIGCPENFNFRKSSPMKNKTGRIVHEDSRLRYQEV